MFRPFIFRFVCIGLAAIVLSACSVNEYQQFSAQAKAQKAEKAESKNGAVKPPAIVSSGFEHITVPNHDIFTLSKAQQQAFKAYFDDPRIKNTRPHWRVVKYLEKYSQDFTYRGDTYTASEALEKQTGNCLSLAILSTSFAELADLRYRYKKVFSAPVYQQYDDIQLVSSHLNLTLYDVARSDSGFTLVPTAVTIDYFKMPGSIATETVSQDTVKIMYWHNLASEAILQADYDLAFAYAMKAQNIDPMYPETLNLIAILYNRTEQEERAFTLYDYMVSHHLYSFTTLDNFSIMLREKGHVARANALLLQTQHIRDGNPYTWLNRGKEYLDQQDFRLAEQYFQQSAQTAPYLHEPYFYLAQVYAKQHKLHKTEQALLKAKELAQLPEDQQRYQAKLYRLTLPL